MLDSSNRHLSEILLGYAEAGSETVFSLRSLRILARPRRASATAPVLTGADTVHSTPHGECDGGEHRTGSATVASTVKDRRQHSLESNHKKHFRFLGATNTHSAQYFGIGNVVAGRTA